MATKSWMWQNENTGGVQGATLNIEKQSMIWYDEPGCGCAAGSEVVQTIAEFRKYPALLVPDDVLEEMHAAITTLNPA